MTQQINGLAISDDFEWIDEFGWSPLVDSSETSLTGAVIVERAERQAGRPITLAGGDGVWMTRAKLAPLLALANGAVDEATLTLYDSRTFAVAFDHSSGPAVTAEPLYRETAPGADQLMTNITIKLITLE